MLCTFGHLSQPHSMYYKYVKQKIWKNFEKIISLFYIWKNEWNLSGQ